MTFIRRKHFCPKIWLELRVYIPNFPSFPIFRHRLPGFGRLARGVGGEGASDGDWSLQALKNRGMEEPGREANFERDELAIFLQFPTQNDSD